MNEGEKRRKRYGEREGEREMERERERDRASHTHTHTHARLGGKRSQKSFKILDNSGEKIIGNSLL